MSEKPPPPDGPDLLWEGVLDQALARDTQELIEEQRAQLAAHPDHPRPCFNLGVLYYMQGRVEDAIAMHKEALARDPSFALAHQYLGQIYVVLGDYQKAWTHARQAAELGNTMLLDMLSRYPGVTQPEDPQAS